MKTSIIAHTDTCTLRGRSDYAITPCDDLITPNNRPSLHGSARACAVRVTKRGARRTPPRDGAAPQLQELELAPAQRP